MYERLIQIIQNSSRIVFFGGAGVSTESGIPDFRSENGIYHARTSYGHAPEEMLSLRFFKRNPEIFFDYYKKNLIYLNAKPNAAHLALARLETEGKLLSVVTQNIDGLHQMGGSKNVIELHGSVLRNRCLECGSSYDIQYIMDPKNCTGSIPKCKHCSGMIKPQVVLYEEMLDSDVLENAAHVISNADTLIVGGTSLAVYPAAGFLNYFQGDNLILINQSETPFDGRASLILRDPIGVVLGSAVS